MTLNVRILDVQLRDPNSRLLELSEQTELVDAPCPVCGLSDRLLCVSQCAASVATAHCRRCGHFYFSRRPTAAWYQEHYRSAWCQGTVHGTNTASGTWLGSTMRQMAKRVLRRRSGPLTDSVAHFDFCRPYLRGVKRVLEVGSGSGRYLLPFLRQHIECCAIEPSPAAAQACRQRGIAVLDSYIEDAAVERYGRPELVISNHSVEHHCDPNVFFSFAARLLPRGGRLCISVPNHEALFLWSECLFVLHVHSFTERSLTAILGRYGFRVVSKQVDDQLRFMAERISDGPLETSQTYESSAANVADQYARRFAASVLGETEGTAPRGRFALSYEIAPLPYTPGWGRYRVQVACRAADQQLLDAADAPHLRSMLLDVEPAAGDEPLLRIFGDGGKAPPLLVK